MIDVADTTETPVQAEPPTVTPEAPVKLVPVIVIEVPPAAAPDDGDTSVTVGVGTAVYVKPLDLVTCCPKLSVTTTFFAPTVPAGVTHVRDVEETIVSDVQAEPPTVTPVIPRYAELAIDAKFVPVRVIVVPPAPLPEVGETDETVEMTVVYVAEFAAIPSDFVVVMVLPSL